MKGYKLILRQVISHIYAIILTILLVLLFVMIGLYVGVFNKQVILGKVQESNYYYEVHKELNENANEILSREGLNKDILQDVITLERVYISGNNYMENALSGGEANVQTNRLREDLERNIWNYLESNNIAKHKELEAGVNELITMIEKEYIRGIQFQFIRYISMYKQEYIGGIKWLLPSTILLIGILSWSLIAISKYKYSGLRYITYSVMASTGLVLCTSAYLLISKAHMKFEVYPRYYNGFIENYLYQGILIFLYMSGIGVISFILLLGVTNYMKKTMLDKGSR